MSKVQYFTLAVNPKNGTVVIPKKLREILKISGTSKSTLRVEVSGNKAQINIPKYTLEDVLYNLPPLVAPKKITDEQIKESMQELAVERYLKSNL